MRARAMCALLGIGLAALAGCSPAVCYPGESQPRFVGHHAATGAAALVPARLRVVSFNVQLSNEVEAAARLLAVHPRLQRADVVLLQEMNELGTDAIARRLGLDYVYYPAIRQPKNGRNFGNAVLSRWPIASDRKLVLPGKAVLNGAIRTATVAELAIGTRRLTVASAHLATPFELGPGGRRAQLLALVGAVAARPAVIGADFNDPELPDLLSRRGFAWLTRDIGGTAQFGRSIDHILSSGLARAPLAVGKVTGYPGISDHVPVYAEVVLRARE